MWLPFDAALRVFYQIQIRISAWPCNPRLPRCSMQQVLGIRSVRCALRHRAWTWLVLQWVVVKVWHSLSVEDLVKIPPSGHDCPRSRPMAAYNYGKGTTIPWRKRLRRYIVAGHRQDGEALRDVLWRPHGSPYRAFLVEIHVTVLSGMSKIRPMAAAFKPVTEVPTTLHRWASAVLHIVAVWMKIIPVKRNGRSGFTG